jgi:uridine phosphorylase
LTKRDWLSILGIPEERIPQVLLLRGTRDLKGRYRQMSEYFSNIQEIGSPNCVIDDVFLGELDGVRVAYASVYGAPMASEIVHIFGVLGTRFVMQIGCCGGLADEMGTGDLFVATEAFCGDGASRYYRAGEGGIVTATFTFEHQARRTGTPVYRGRIYTTSALLAEGEREIQAWHDQGYHAVDMETSATFAVAEHFGMARGSILYVFDNPRRKEHILTTGTEKAQKREIGDKRMTEFVLATIRNCKENKDREPAALGCSAELGPLGRPERTK